MRRYKVLDETGQSMRIFPSKAEAKRFLQDGWSIVIIEARDKYKHALHLVGEALV
jgi:hypothetical protein